MTKRKEGISVNLVSRQKLDEFSTSEKLEFILKEVQKGKVLVLEHGLTPLEQTELIEQTMKEIKEDTFIGIEMEETTEDLGMSVPGGSFTFNYQFSRHNEPIAIEAPQLSD